MSTFISFTLNGDLPSRLNRVRVEQHTALSRNRADFLNVLNNADFIVGCHDRDEDGFVRDCPARIVRINKSFIVDRQERDSESFFLEVLTGIEYRLMLGDAVMM